ncbi:MAG: hypothetical protein V3S70_03680, partial [Gammaproteobacteria bacterium]
SILEPVRTAAGALLPQRNSRSLLNERSVSKLFEFHYSFNYDRAVRCVLPTGERLMSKKSRRNKNHTVPTP